MWPRPLLDLGFAHPYLPSLGFAVAVDAAARLGRSLPAIALTSVFPPGSFYQDHPVSDDVKVHRRLYPTDHPTATAPFCSHRCFTPSMHCALADTRRAAQGLAPTQPS